MSIPIGEHRAPTPNNCPEYIRVDNIPQGDQACVTGIDHIKAMDYVTQYEGGTYAN